MSDDKVEHIITRKTLGLDQLEGFDSQGNPGPLATQKTAFAEVRRLTNENEVAFRAGYGHGMNDAKHSYPPRPKGAYNEWRKAPVSEEQCQHEWYAPYSGRFSHLTLVCKLCGATE